MSELERLKNVLVKTADDITASQKAAVLKALPVLKKAYENQMKGSGRRMMKGRGFWEWLSGAASDVNNWLKENKILSKIAAPVLQYILPAAAGVFGTPVSGAAVGAAGFAATEGLKALGYGKKRGGRCGCGMTANDLVRPINMLNPVSGPRGRGSMVQDFQSSSLKKIGSGTKPSHLQPFLTSKRIKGSGVSQALYSIGNVGRIKM
jgi:hypothetical protein